MATVRNLGVCCPRVIHRKWYKRTASYVMVGNTHTHTHTHTQQCRNRADSIDFDVVRKRIVVFNDALNIFYIRLFGVGRIVS